MDVPLPHLSSVAFFRNSAERSCSPPPRPVPPTPHRMRPTIMYPLDPDVAGHRKRYSVSAIPRPSSGTSRRATPLGLPQLTAPDDEASEPPPAHRRLCHSADGKPPSAWIAAKPRLPRSDSLLPYDQRPQGDLSGLKQQLQVRHYSTQSLSSPSHIAASRDASLTNSNLPKSHSAALSLSPSRDITPRRRLMKPLSPPLPKSQTSGSLSCTAKAGPTPSPPKAVQPRVTLATESLRSQINVVDALRESRMTEDEITQLRQVQKEAATNQGHLKHAVEIRQHKQKTPTSYVSPTSSSFTRNPNEATINLSANDIANTRRLEDQRRKSASGRPLYINSVLANAIKAEVSLSIPNTVASASSSGPEEEWETNNKHVQFAAEPAYWAGRYSSISDRLRTENMRAAMTASPSSLSSDDSDRPPWESSDARRMNTALRELRACCRTEIALQSLETFEAQLRKSTNMPWSPQWTRMSARGSDLRDEHTDRILKVRLNTQHALQSRSTPATVTRTSRIPTPAKPEPPLPSIFSRLALTKSKTTSNLATLSSLSTFGISNVPTSKVLLPSTSNSLEAKTTEQHVRQKAGIETSERVDEAAFGSPEDRTKPCIADAKRRISNRTTSIGSEQSSRSSGSIQANISKFVRNSHLRNASTTTSLPQLCHGNSHANVNRDVRVTEGVSVRALEAGHRDSQPARPRSPGEADVELVNANKDMRPQWDANAKADSAEQVSRSRIRTRSERQSSGEVVKNLFDVGMTQVKRMGRRVGGSMSWAGSAEDLNAMVSGRGAEK